jgi:tetratricopeptide (TPR) repeat protein
MKNMNTEALADLDKAITLDSANTFAYFNRALLRYNNKNINGALSDLEKVLKEEPGNALTLYNRALIRSNIGDFDNALSDYDKVLEINPNNVLAYYNRASLFTQQGRWRDAMDDYSKAINLYPDFANAYMNRSYVKNRLGQFNSAKTDYQIALQKVQEYKNKMSDSTTASAFADTTKKYDKLLALDADFARKDFDNELLQHKDVDIRLKPMFKIAPVETKTEKLALEHFYYNEKVASFISSVPMKVELTTTVNVHSAADDKSKLSSGTPISKDLEFFGKAISEASKKQFNAALDSYNKAIEANPSQTFYFMNRGVLQAEMIDFISSIESNVRVLTLDNAGTARAKVQDGSARNYDYSPAIHDLIKACGLFPEFPYNYYNLGNLYSLSNDLPEAIKQYTQALELYPYLAEAYYNRGLVLIYLKDKDKGCLDISKAGELGIQEAYSVIKKYCTDKDK